MNIINISGEIGWDVTPDDVKTQLSAAKGKDIDVHLASPGGFVFDGIEIYNALRDYKKQYPKCQMMLTIKGLAASMASYIAVNPAFDLIAAEDNAVFMIHNAWGGAVGDYRDMKKAAEIMEGITDLLGKAYSNKTGKDQKEVRKLMDEESWYFGNEILESGFVDEIIKSPEKTEKIEEIKKAKVNFTALSEKLVKSKTDFSQLAAIIQPENPYPTEHAARIIEPDKFEKDSFRRKNIAEGIDTIMGHLKGETTMTIQAYRFNKDKFTVAEAKKWLSDHDIKYILFEPASGTSDNTCTNPAMRDNITEVTIMSLKDLLEQNPAAKIEYENELKLKEIAGYEKGKADMIEISSKAAKFASSKEYPEQVKNIALEVMQGKKSVDALDSIVTTADMIKELTKSKSATDEQPADTKPEDEGKPNPDGEVNSMESIVAEAKRLKGVK